MPFSALTRWATSVALVVATLPAAAAVASPSPQSSAAPDAPGAAITPAHSRRHVPELPETAAPTARELLAEARSLFAGDADSRGRRSSAAAAAPGQREASLTLLQLQLRKNELSPAERREADQFAARPTGSDLTYNYPARARLKTTCDDSICVHWTPTGEDAPPAGDRNVDGIPDQVDTTLATMQQVWNRIVTKGGYKAPKRDKGKKASPAQGPNRKFDVYLADVGVKGYYGYCTVDPFRTKQLKRNGWDLPAYCVLDNDFTNAGFGTAKTPVQLLQATAAHEFFHAVQFAYDVGEDRWFMEGTAAWIEDEIYDDVNDNRTFLKYSQAKNPNKPLDFGPGPFDGPDPMYSYGSWIFWRFLTESLPGEKRTGLPVIVKQAWKRADASASDPRKRGTYSIKATKKALKARNQDLTKLYARFGEANRHPESAYEEGKHYPTVPLKERFTLSGDQPQIAEHKATMPHLTNFSVGFDPGAGIGKRWRLALKVDGPRAKRGSYAQASVVRTDGSRKVVPIKLDGEGRGGRKVSFDVDRDARVELTMTNAGTRFRCGQQTIYSCAGKSRDNGATFFFRARAIAPR